MTKLEKLAEIINVSIDTIITEFDNGMIDILLELNKKNYRTSVCCEGHLREDGSWNGYIGFIYPYNFMEYPNNFSSVKNRQYYYWEGKGEESRQKYLENVLAWAKRLPYRELEYEKGYTLYGKNKRNPNGKEKILKYSTNYEDIRVLFNRADMYKYDTRVEERILKTY